MAYDYLLFDLDGTISDPQDGIVNCLNYSLRAHGFDERPAGELVQFIGPPLDYTFSRLTGSEDPALIEALVEKYRERYGETGFSENTLYPGIPALLKTLKDQSQAIIGLCTSKRKDFAERILQLFQIDAYFAFVSGGDVGVPKGAQIRELLDTGTITTSALMIGDRHYDLRAANENAIDAAGVLWGYGSREELSEHSPAYIFSTPDQLCALTDNRD